MIRKFLFLSLLFVCGPLLADEQPPFEVTDPATTENFRQVYYTVDQLVSAVSSSSSTYATIAGTQTFTGVNTFTGANVITAASINGSGLWGFRNRILNGDMRIDQKNVGAAFTVNVTATVRHLDGNWQGSGAAADGVFTVQQLSATPPTGFTHYIRCSVTTADASIGAGQRYYVGQPIEGSNIRDFLLGSASAKTFTLSFWVRSSVTGTFSGVFLNGAGNESYPFTYVINAADTWEQKSVTVAGDTGGTWVTTTAAGIYAIFDLGSGSSFRGTAGAWTGSGFIGATGATSLISTLNATWDLTGVQLELGSIATAFEFRPITIELASCQRYFWKTLPQALPVVDNPGSTNSSISYRVTTAGVSNNGVAVRFPVSMRGTPTVTFYNPNATGSNWRNANDTATSGASAATQTGSDAIYVTNAQVAGDGVGELCVLHATASSEL